MGLVSSEGEGLGVWVGELGWLVPWTACFPPTSLPLFPRLHTGISIPCPAPESLVSPRGGWAWEPPGCHAAWCQGAVGFVAEAAQGRRVHLPHGRLLSICYV